MKDLTNEQLSGIWHAQASSGNGSGFYDIIRAAIKADRELNGRTGEVQPEQRVTPEMFKALQDNLDVIARAHNRHVEIGEKYGLNDEVQPAEQANGAVFDFTALEKAMSLASLLAGSVGMNDVAGSTGYANDLRAHLSRYLAHGGTTQTAQPAADDKAGGEPVTGRDLFVAWWDGYGMQPGVECSLPVWKYQETAIQSAWNHVATRYYTNPHTQSEVRVPDGYALVPVEPTLEMGWAYLDAANACSPDKEHSFNHAGYRAMLSAAPKPQDDLPAILKKQAS